MMRKIMLSFFGALSLMLCFVSTPMAAPYIISQTQHFSLTPAEWRIDEGDMNGQEQYITETIDDMNVPFFGAPSSILLAGNTWDFSGVKYELSGTLNYKFEAYCRDGFCSDCYTLGFYMMGHQVGPEGVIFPTQEQVLHFDGPNFMKAHDPGHLLEDAVGRNWIERTISMQQSYYLLTNDYDMSFLEVEEFNVQLLRILIGGIWDRDTGDTYNSMRLASYQWEGSISIDYEYSPHAIPLPGAVWLLGSGLVGLVGLRKKLKK